MKIDITDRDFLIALREEAEKWASTPCTNPTWVRAALALADAADHLDAMNARCTVNIEEGRHELKVVFMPEKNKGEK
jgi:hypothetical protein